MADSPNQEANSQSYKLDENELQNLEESKRQSECITKFAFVEWNSLDPLMCLSMQAKLPVSYFQWFKRFQMAISCCL